MFDHHRILTDIRRPPPSEGGVMWRPIQWIVSPCDKWWQSTITRKRQLKVLLQNMNICIQLADIRRELLLKNRRHHAVAGAFSEIFGHNWKHLVYAMMPGSIYDAKCEK
jgi:hypothetical protein